MNIDQELYDLIVLNGDKLCLQLLRNALKAREKRKEKKPTKSNIEKLASDRLKEATSEELEALRAAILKA